MVKAYKAVLSLPVHEQLTSDILTGRLAEAERQYRINQKTTMYLKLSKLRHNVVLEQV